jgi:hypothetical protein
MPRCFTGKDAARVISSRPESFCPVIVMTHYVTGPAIAAKWAEDADYV